jgi:hypothetical protein
MGSEMSFDHPGRQFEQAGWVGARLGGAAGGVVKGTLGALTGDPDFSGVSENVGQIYGAFKGEGVGGMKYNDIYNPPSSSEIHSRQVFMANKINTSARDSALPASFGQAPAPKVIHSGGGTGPNL